MKKLNKGNIKKLVREVLQERWNDTLLSIFKIMVNTIHSSILDADEHASIFFNKHIYSLPSGKTYTKCLLRNAHGFCVYIFRLFHAF